MSSSILVVPKNSVYHTLLALLSPQIHRLLGVIIHSGILGKKPRRVFCRKVMVAMGAADNSVIKINKWDGSAVKNALDDAVKDVLTKKYNYLENFALLDGRLFLCGIAVTIAIVALLCDYMYPFPASKPVLIACVSFYFLLMALLTLYTTYKEKGIFVVAVQRDPAGFNPDMIWEASSYLKKYDDKYNLVLSVKSVSVGVINETSVTKSVANFIDVNGVVIPELIEAVVTSMHDSLTLQRKDK